MKKFSVLIAAILIASFLIPLSQADENRENWSKSVYVQSAKIQYQHVYKKSKLRDDLYHCIILLKEALSKYPGDPELYYMLGNFYAEINAFDTVIAYFDSVTAFCEDETIDEKLRKNCYNKENYIKKMADLRKDFWEKSYNDGVNYMEEYDLVAEMKNAAVADGVGADSVAVIDSLLSLAFDLSMVGFDNALKAIPNDTTALNGVAVLYMRNNDFESALEVYNKLLDVKGEDPTIINRVAYAYISAENWEKAVEWYGRYLEIVPDDKNALINMAVSYNKMEQYDKWYEYTEKVLEIDPDNIPNLFNAGQYWWYIKRIELNVQFSEIDDNDPEAEAKREAIDEKVTECATKSAGYFERILELVPEDCDASRLLGYVNMQIGEFAKVIELLNKNIEVCPPDEDVLYYLGQAYYRSGDMVGAIKPFEMLVELNPDSQRGWEILADLYNIAKMKDKTEAARAKVKELKGE